MTIERRVFDWVVLVFLVMIQVTQVAWLKAFYYHEGNVIINTAALESLSAEVASVREVEQLKIQKWQAFHNEIRGIISEMNANAIDIKEAAREISEHGD